VSSLTFTVTTPVWLWKGDSPWHFITIPAEIADEVREYREVHGVMRRGFGSVRIEARDRESGFTWNTSMFPDKESGGYLLPLKKEAREAMECEVGETVTLVISLV